MFHALEQGWTTSDHLLAHVIDALWVNNWQRTRDATKRPPRNIPERFPRPGDLQPAEGKPAKGSVVDVGGVAAKVTSVGEFLAMRAEREKRWREQNNQQGGA